MDAKESITLYKKARAHLILNEPFYGQLSSKLEPIIDPNTPTLWTNGINVGFNPKFIESIPFDQLKAEICHEVEHVARGHCWRREARNPKKWNIAADHEINPNLKANGFMLGKDWLLDMQYAGMPAEQIYSMLPDQPQGNQGQGQGPDPSQPDLSEVRDAPPGEAQTLKTDWQVSVIQAANIAKAYGKLPAGMAELVEKLRKAKVDWKSALRKFVQQTSKADYTWTQPNRRYVSQGLYLPSLKSDSLGPIIFYIDTSGSRYSQPARDRAVSEVTEMIYETRPEFTLVICGDSKVQGKPQRFGPDDDIKIELKGGGGTNFEPIFDYVASEGIEPACFIGITDLDGSFPSVAPAYPVLWLAIGDSPAPFGEVLRIED